LARLLAPVACAALAAALTSCATPPAPTPPEPVAEVPAPPSEIARAAERRRAQARQFERASDLAGAETQWQIVALLAPDDREAGERLAALRATKAKIASDELAAAREALRRSEFELAQQSLLRVLAYDAHNEEAVAALREIDRQRALRRAADMAARARAGEAVMATRSRSIRTAPPAPPEGGDYNLEQGLELLRAGDAKAALPELRRYVAGNPRDRAGRERIALAVRAQAQQLERQGAGPAAADLYAEAIKMHAAAPREWSAQLAQLKSKLAGQEYEQGVRMMATDVNAAIAHFEAALRLAPDHAQAQLRLDRARRIQQNLRAIGPARNSD
jgi:tetratricopeptide (TPR) repeat protein